MTGTTPFYRYSSIFYSYLGVKTLSVKKILEITHLILCRDIDLCFCHFFCPQVIVSEKVTTVCHIFHFEDVDM